MAEPRDDFNEFDRAAWGRRWRAMHIQLDRLVYEWEDQNKRIQTLEQTWTEVLEKLRAEWQKMREHVGRLQESTAILRQELKELRHMVEQKNGGQ